MPSKFNGTSLSVYSIFNNSSSLTSPSNEKCVIESLKSLGKQQQNVTNFPVSINFHCVIKQHFVGRIFDDNRYFQQHFYF